MPTPRLVLLLSALAIFACRQDITSTPPTLDVAAQTVAEFGGLRVSKGAEWFVSPTGSIGGKGTRGRPWDLATALSGAGGVVRPGDVIWLRHGRYEGIFRSEISGSPDEPITIRQLPGERATIDGALFNYGSNVTFWGFEITQSDPTATPNLPALETHGNNERFINLVIHDAGQQGVTLGRGMGYSELYGSLIYNNGSEEEKDHGIYATNDAGEKRIIDNVVFNNLASGIHVFATPNHPALTNVLVEGNAAFNTGTISSLGAQLSNVTMGGDPQGQNDGMRAMDNMLYFSGLTGQNLRLGLEGRRNVDALVRGNYVVGGHTVLRMEDWDEAVVENNTLVGMNRIVRLSATRLDGHRWSDNTYVRDPAAKAWNFQGTAYSLSQFASVTGLGGRDRATADLPTEPKVFVRPNKYEPGRATVVVYNWGRQPAVAVDVSGILRRGARWELRNVQDIFGDPVAAGVYHGGSIDVPMTGIAPPPAVGRPGTPPQTGPDFDVFLLTSTGPPDREAGGAPPRRL